MLVPADVIELEPGAEHRLYVVFQPAADPDLGPSSPLIATWSARRALLNVAGQSRVTLSQQ